MKCSSYSQNVICYSCHFLNLYSNYWLESTATVCSTGFYQLGVTTNVKFSLCMVGRPVGEWKCSSISALGKVKVKGKVHPRTGHEGMEGE